MIVGIALVLTGAKLLWVSQSRWGKGEPDPLQVQSLNPPSETPDSTAASFQVGLPNPTSLSTPPDLPPPLPSAPEGWSYTHSSEPHFSDHPTLRELLNHPNEFKVWLSSLSLGPSDLRLAHEAVLALSGSELSSELTQELSPEMRHRLLMSSIEALGNSNLTEAQDALTSIYTTIIYSKSPQAESIANAVLSELVPQPKSDSKTFQLFVGIAGDPSHPHYAQAVGTLAVVLTGYPDLEAKTLSRLSPQSVQDIQKAKASHASLAQGDPVSNQLRQQGH
jgi:hypothetical protein